MVSTYTFSDNLTDLRENIQLKSDQGLSLIDIDYIDDPKDKGLVGEEEIWVAEFGDVPGNTIYIFNENEDVFVEKTNQKTEKGYDLVDVEYADGVFFGILTDSPGNKAVTLSENLDALAEQIQERWDKNYHLANVEYVDGQWLGFYSTPSSLSKNAYVSRATIDEFTGQIEQKWDENFDLVNVEYGDGKWFGVFTQTPESSAYSTSTNFDHFSETFTTNLENGYYLTDLEYGDGVLFAVYETVQSAPSTGGSDPLTDDFYFNDAFNSIVGNFSERTDEIIDDFGGPDGFGNPTADNIDTSSDLFRKTFLPPDDAFVSLD